tara:strand:- start:199 stop:399 length:201 start_codon:yes stop_codon:yes gene_type:complete
VESDEEMKNPEIDDWVIVKNEDDKFHVKSVDPDRGYAELEDITGHTWHCQIREIEKILTNEEIHKV